jgi:Uma2 family endonuclease
MRVAERTALSSAEFLAWERQQPVRHEFFRGEAFAMAGGSLRHNALSARVIAALQSALPATCRVFSSDQRVGLARGERYVYPDVTVVCGAVTVEPGASDVLTNPTTVVEVLSTSTEQYDRGLKWEGYQRIPSLVDYVLISQSEPRIERFERTADGGWLYRSEDLRGSVEMAHGVVLVVERIFAGMFELPGD